MHHLSGALPTYLGPYLPTYLLGALPKKVGTCLPTTGTSYLPGALHTDVMGYPIYLPKEDITYLVEGLLT